MKDWFGPGWLREEVDAAVVKVKQWQNAHKCRCHLRDPGADDVELGAHQSQSQK